MNEENSADKPQRPDFLQLIFIINALPDDQSEEIRQNQVLMDQFFEQHGWTVGEAKEYFERYVRGNGC